MPSRTRMGRTLMVPNAAPGDRLEVAITSRRGDFSFANIERLIEAGPDRRAAPCPFLPRCGGCDWQHLNYPAQLRRESGTDRGGAASRQYRGQHGESDRAGARGIRLSLAHPAEGGPRRRARIPPARQQRVGGDRSMHRRLAADCGCRMRSPRHWRNLDEIEVVASGEREVIVAMMRKPPSAAEIERARQILAAGRVDPGNHFEEWARARGDRRSRGHYQRRERTGYSRSTPISSAR